MKTLDEIKKYIRIEIKVCNEELEHLKHTLSNKVYSQAFRDGREHELENSRKTYQKILNDLDNMGWVQK